MNKKWSEKTTFEKTISIISGVAFGVWLILELLGKSNLEMVSCIALCIVCVCEAIHFWNVKRWLSWVAIAGIVFMLSAMILLAII